MPTHAEHKLLPYSPEQLFDLVADVAKYPEFLPWCVGARIISSTKHAVEAVLTIGFGPFRESFTSKVTLDRPSQIRVAYERGPFHHLNNTWSFEPDPKGTRVKFWVDFEFRSRLLRAAIGPVFNEAVRRMVNSFLKRARDVYGPPVATVAVTPSTIPEPAGS